MVIKPEYGLKSYRDAIAFFEEMDSRAVSCAAKDLADLSFPQADKAATYRVFRGYLKDVAVPLGFNSSKYSGASQLLQRVRAITILARPTSWGPGAWILNFKPTNEQFEELNRHAQDLERKIKPDKYSALVAEINVLKGRLRDVEKQLKNLNQLTKNMQNPVSTELGEAHDGYDPGPGS